MIQKHNVKQLNFAITLFCKSDIIAVFAGTLFCENGKLFTAFNVNLQFWRNLTNLGLLQNCFAQQSDHKGDIQEHDLGSQDPLWTKEVYEFQIKSGFQYNLFLNLLRKPGKFKGESVVAAILGSHTDQSYCT